MLELSEEFVEGQEVSVELPERTITGHICGKAYDSIITGWIVRPHVHHLEWINEQGVYPYSTFVAPHTLITKI
jgi:hypothetical protein